MNNDFLNNTLEKLDKIDSSIFLYQELEFHTFKTIYKDIESFAIQHELINTIISLKLVRGLLIGRRSEIKYKFKNDGVYRNTYFAHALYTANMIINLQPKISDEEFDIALSSALCHVLIEKVDFDNNGKEIVDLYYIDETIYDIIMLNLRNKSWKNDEIQEYYQRIQENKIALLVKLADRGNIVEQLYEADLLEASKYVKDTKDNFLPMCIYGKEHYPELETVFNIQMSKMRWLIDINDLINYRYARKIDEVKNEILELKEDNSRIRIMISKYNMQNS